MGRCFDTYVAVDWSAAAVPRTGRDSIWIAVRRSDRTTLVNPATREQAVAVLDEVLDGVGAGGPGRVLVGIDVPLGFPAGTAAALGRPADDPVPEWRWTWALLERLVHDDELNRNNRFHAAAELNQRIAAVTGAPGPFWGHPAGRTYDALGPTRPAPPDDAPARPLATWRRCEEALRDRGLRPFSVWQLAYAGSVGGQALTALARLHGLLERRPQVEVWPFTTGLGVRPADLAPDAVLLAEVWPSAFAVDRSRHAVKDAAQVLHVVDELERADGASTLGSWWSAGVPARDRSPVEREEGWILGPGPRTGE